MAGVKFGGTGFISRIWVAGGCFLSAFLFPHSDLQADPGKYAGGSLILTPEVAANPHGDGPDGKGNTGDDTWQFWLQIIHDRNLFIHLDLATKIQPDAIRQNGIRRKVWGPLGKSLPNPEQTEGFIYHSNWNGQREGVWGDSKAKQVLVVPYQEKGDGGALAVTCTIPAAGKYLISGKATDLEVDTEHKFSDGIRVSVEVTDTGNGKTIRRMRKVLVKPIAFGDKGPGSVEFKSDPVAIEKGQLVFVMIDPVKIAYKDLVALELKITPVK